MKPSARWRIGGLAVLVVALALFWLSNQNPSSSSKPPEVSEKPVQLPAPQGVERLPVTEMESVSALGDSSVEPAPSASAFVAESFQGEPPKATLPEAIIPVQASSAFQAMAQDYQQLIQFPPYSMPLSPNSHDLLNPYEFIPTKRPMDSANEYAFDLKVSRFLLFRGDPIPVKLTIYANTDKPIPEVLSLQLELVSAGQTVAKIPLELQSESPQQKIYHAEYLPSPEESANWNLELTLKANVLLQGLSETGLTELFQYAPSVAEVTEKGQEQVEGPHLIIPLKFKVQKEGRYKITANLFSAKTGQPIAHLVERLPLSENDPNGRLRVHAVALRAKGDPGPYVLKDFSLQRLPDTLGGEVEYGKALGKEYTIQGAELERYSHEKYSDPILEEKLKFLEKLAQPETEKTP